MAINEDKLTALHARPGRPRGRGGPAGSGATPDVSCPDTLCEVFQATAASYPGEVALRAPGGAVTVTWAQYAARVRQIAAGLAGLGVRRGGTVALMMANRAEFHLIDTAVFHLGAAPFSVYNTCAPEQIRYLLADAGCRVVVCERQFAGRLLAATGGTAVRHVVCVDGKPDGTIPLAQVEAGGDPGFRFEARWRAVGPGDLLTLVYTSGTTGPPKGVEITHGQLLAGLQATRQVLAAGPADRAVSYLPMAHIAERYFSHYTAMAAGMQVTPVADARTLPAALQDVRPTIFVGVPRVWEKLKAAAEAMLADAGRPAGEQARSGIRVALGLDQVRSAFCGAAPIAPQVLEFLGALGLPVAEAWGMSECLIGTANPAGAIRTGTVGTALPGMDLKLAADGELLVRGPTVMRGYRHDPARTAEAIDAGGWLHTGDLAAIDADGYVTITGRKKDLIITAAGKNISPATIEGAVLAGCPLIGQVAAVGDRRPYIVALVALDPDAAALFAARHGITDPSPAVLAGHPAIRAAVGAAVDAANAGLSRVEQVKRFTILPVFWEPGGDELTPTMKLKRQPVTAKYATAIDALYATAGSPAPGRPGD